MLFRVEEFLPHGKNMWLNDEQSIKHNLILGKTSSLVILSSLIYTFQFLKRSNAGELNYQGFSDFNF